VGSDAKYGFVLEKVTREEFEERYPDEEPPGDALKVGKGVAQEIWFENDAFFIADYYVIESETTEMVLTEDGQTWKKEEFEEKLAEWMEAETAKMLFPAPPALPAGAMGATAPLPITPVGTPSGMSQRPTGTPPPLMGGQPSQPPMPGQQGTPGAVARPAPVPPPVPVPPHP
jgi:hypothetical protein